MVAITISLRLRVATISWILNFRKDYNFLYCSSQNNRLFIKELLQYNMAQESYT